jgi:2-keto-4-pentenoate hydratase
MSIILDAQGANVDIPVDVTVYRLAHEAGMTVPQYLANKYPTNAAKYGTVFEQMMAAEGIFVKPNRELGIRPSTMAQILNPGMQAGGVTVKDGVPASRILFPAVFLLALEDKLVANLNMTADAFEQMIAVDEAIANDRYEQPKISYSKPEAGRHQGVAQLAQPASMVTITSSDVAYRIPSFAIGLEISDQALRASTLDIVALSLARQAAVERNERAQNYMTNILNGDVDNGESALTVDQASVTFDSTCSSTVFTQKAWMKYLTKNGTKRTITHIVTDLDSAMRIENRTGKPVITTDDPNSKRIDTTFNIMNPTWAKNPSIFLTQDAAWPANTLMGLDKSWAIRRVRNLNADYQAIEAFVMRRSQQMRFDFGEHVNRLFDEGYGCMLLT